MEISYFQKLSDKGFIDYDRVIPRGVLEDELEINLSAANPWTYLGPLMKLKEQIEANGYFCKFRRGSLVILPLKSMPHRCFRVEHKYRKKCRKAVNTMNNANIAELDDKNKKEHLHATHKMSLLLQSTYSVLKSI